MLKVTGHMLHVARASLKEWIDEATMEEIFLLSTAVDLIRRAGTTPATKHERAVRKSLKARKITLVEGEQIRTAMAGFVRYSPQYLSKRDELCKEMGITTRQFSACVRQKKQTHILPFVSEK